MEVTKILKKARNRKGVTQTEVGEAIGLTAGAYSKIETGVNCLDAQHILPLSDFLGIPVEDLVQACSDKTVETEFKEKIAIDCTDKDIYKILSHQRTGKGFWLNNEPYPEDKNAIILSHANRLSATGSTVLVIGACGTGKTYQYVLPNLLQCNGSYVVIDRGGYLYDATKVFFKEKGYCVEVVDGKNASNENEINRIGEMVSKELAIVYVILDLFETGDNNIVFELFSKVVKNEGDAAKMPVHFVFDEFANEGNPAEKDFVCLLETIGIQADSVSCSVIVQDVSQLEAMYGDFWKRLVEACDSILYLGSSSFDTLQFISEIMEKQRSESWDRAILTPHKTAGVDKNDCILIFKEQAPVIDKKYLTHKHPNFAFLQEK